MKKKFKINIWVINKNTILIALFIVIFLIIILSRIAFSNHILLKDDNIIKDKVIVIDVGHGGVDGGANIGDILEKNINLKIALKLNTILKANGAKAILTRDKDISLDKLINNEKSRYLRDLGARIQIINSSNADLFISIHCNYISGNSSENGTMIFFKEKGSPSQILAENIMNCIHNTEQKEYQRNQHSPQIGDYYLLRNSKIPGVIIETGFISNKYDRELLLDNDFINKIAISICLGINEFFKEQ